MAESELSGGEMRSVERWVCRSYLAGKCGRWSGGCVCVGVIWRGSAVGGAVGVGRTGGIGGLTGLLRQVCLDKSMERVIAAADDGAAGAADEGFCCESCGECSCGREGRFSCVKGNW